MSRDRTHQSLAQADEGRPTHSQPDAASQQALLLEQYAERAVLALRRAANFTESLSRQGLSAEITVLSPRGKTLTVRGRDLSHEGTWQKFLTQAQLPASTLYSLMQGSDEIIRRYRSFLLSAHTKRYQAISTSEHLAWFRAVSRLAVLWHMVEAKYQHAAFADPWVAQEIEALHTLGMLATEVAKAIHHIVKEPREEAALLIEHLYHVHADRLTHPRLAPPPLPALPQGVHPPLLMELQRGQAVEAPQKEARQ
jgi:hypothetical protein